MVSCATIVVPQPVNADVMGISATSFVGRNGATVVGEESQGLLLNAAGNYFAPVIFPRAGDQICRFSLLYRDFDSDFNVTARLKRKVVSLQGSAFAPPILMAQASSSGFADAPRRSTDTTVVDRVVKPGASFYFVELFLPANTLQVMGVQIVFEPTCP